MARKARTVKATDTATTTRAAIYCRVSTDEQAAHGFGLAVQLERCRAMATAKGMTVIGEHADTLSGTLPPDLRPGLGDVMAAVSAGDVDAVIVYALDRIGRRTSIVLDVVERLRVAGCAIVSCRESLDSTTPSGQFVLTMFAGLAQLERDVIVDRTTAGRNARGEVDGDRGGQVPLGYVRAADRVTVDVAAADVVRRILAQRDAGATLQAIADGLVAAGVPTARGGASWYPSTVRAVLANRPAYAGGTRGSSSVRWPCITA